MRGRFFNYFFRQLFIITCAYESHNKKLMNRKKQIMPINTYQAIGENFAL